MLTHRTYADSESQPWDSLLYQGDVWTDRHGHQHLIKTMSIASAQAAIEACEQEAEPIQLAVLGAGVSNSVAQLGRDARSATASARLERALLDAQRDPIDWLRHTPLLQALRKRVEDADRDGPACDAER